MFKSFLSVKSGHVFVCMTTVAYTIGGLSQPILASENLERFSKQIVNYAGSDLSRPDSSLSVNIPRDFNPQFERQYPVNHSSQLLLTQEIDWDVFCEKFPENSMCQVEREEPEPSEAESPETPETEPEEAQPEEAEQPELKPPEIEPNEAEESEASESEAEQQPSGSDSDSENSSNEQQERKWGSLNENSGVAIEPQVSSLGLGMDLTARVSGNVNARAGFGVWSLTEDFKRTDVKYNADVKLRSGAAVMDVYPIEGTEIRLSGGIMLNGNQVDTIGQSETVVVAGVQQQVYTIGGRTFTAQQVGTLSGEITFPLVAPFVGVGWGNAVKPGRRLGFTVDLGVMIHGTPQISLRATNQAVTPQLQESINKEIEDLTAEFDGFKFYPVLQVGISYQF